MIKYTARRDPRTGFGTRIYLPGRAAAGVLKASIAEVKLPTISYAEKRKGAGGSRAGGKYA